MIRVVLPSHLRTLAQVGSEISVPVSGAVTQRAVLDAIEAAYPMLRGTMRDHVTQQRRAFVRFFADEQDLSHEPRRMRCCRRVWRKGGSRCWWWGRWLGAEATDVRRR